MTNPKFGEYEKVLQAHGLTAYVPPAGDKGNVKDWNQFGPGTVLRVKNQGYYYPAKTLLGEQAVLDAMKPENATPISLFSGKRFSGYDFDGSGGWTLEGLNQIQGAVGANAFTDVEVQFGNAWKVNPKSESELQEALRVAAKEFLPGIVKALKRKQFVVVQDIVWTDSVRYVLKKGSAGSVSATYKLGPEEIAKLKAQGFQADEGGVIIDSPRFIAYRALPPAP